MRSFALFLAAVSFSSLCRGVPANPEPTPVSQPDGSSFMAMMKGDERQSWMETVKGYTVIKNKATGWFEYALRGRRGLVPSGIVVKPNGEPRDVTPAKRPKKGIRPPPD
jgi:hypothetical protein